MRDTVISIYTSATVCNHRIDIVTGNRHRSAVSPKGKNPLERVDAVMLCYFTRRAITTILF